MLTRIQICAAVFAPLILLFAGCISGMEEMSRIAEEMNRRQIPVFENVVMRFVDSALNEDLNGMIALTSKVTIERIGLENLREHYAKDTIPALKRVPRMSSRGKIDPLVDELGSQGWIFKKTFTSATGENAKFTFIVLKERGDVKISALGVWK